MIGVLCQAWPPPTWQGAKGWQAVVAYELIKAFRVLGVDAQPVVWDAALPGREYALPAMNHAIVVTELARRAVNRGEEYSAALRRMVDGQLCLYLDAPMVGFRGSFDQVFTGEDWPQDTDLGFRAKHDQFIPVGFGSDEHFHPEPKTGGPRRIVSQYPDITLLQHFQEEWAIAQDVLMELSEDGWECVTLSYVAPWSSMDGIVVHAVDDPRAGQEGDPWMPLVGQECDKELWHKWEGVGRYVPYHDLPAYFNRADVYLDLRGGALDLTRIDAAYAGMTIVAHAKNWRQTVHGKLGSVEWSTAEELYELITMPVDRYDNAIEARQHTWCKVALRMLEVLEGQ